MIMEEAIVGKQILDYLIKPVNPHQHFDRIKHGNSSTNLKHRLRLVKQTYILQTWYCQPSQ